jgi:hypothetical protein
MAMETNKSENKPNEPIHRPFFPTFFHGTKSFQLLGQNQLVVNYAGSV